MTTDVAQLNMLEIIPDPFVRVEVRRIPRQLLQADLRGGSPRQERFDGLVTVDRDAIPDHQQPASELAAHVLEEAHRIRPPKCALLHSSQQLALGCYPTDEREMIARQR